MQCSASCSTAPESSWCLAVATTPCASGPNWAQLLCYIFILFCLLVAVSCCEELPWAPIFSAILKPQLGRDWLLWCWQCQLEEPFTFHYQLAPHCPQIRDPLVLLWKLVMPFHNSTVDKYLLLMHSLDRQTVFENSLLLLDSLTLLTVMNSQWFMQILSNPTPSASEDTLLQPLTTSHVPSSNTTHLSERDQWQITLSSAVFITDDLVCVPLGTRMCTTTALGVGL